MKEGQDYMITPVLGERRQILEAAAWALSALVNLKFGEETLS